MKTKEITYNIEPFGGFDVIEIQHDIISGYWIRLITSKNNGGAFAIFKEVIIGGIGLLANKFLIDTSAKFDSIEECHYFLDNLSVEKLHQYIDENKIKANFLISKNPVSVPKFELKKCNGIEPINLTVFSYNLGEINDLIYRKIMTENPTIKRKDLAKKLGVNERTIYRELKRLKLN